MSESDESKVLSTDEVNALLNVTQVKTADLNALISGVDDSVEKWQNNFSYNTKALATITELTWNECENAYSAFLRKKIMVRTKAAHFAKFSEAMQVRPEKNMFTIFKLNPTNRFSLVAIDYQFLHQAINLLYGGLMNTKEPVLEQPGKIGTMIAEKICQLALDGFVNACKDFGELQYETIKIVTVPNLISKFNEDDHVYTIELTVHLNEVESIVNIIVTEEFLREFIPTNVVDVHHVESNFWRTAIQTQVADSEVTVCVTLPNIKLKVNDIMSLKTGDLIPISDPNLVYVCLNNIKLFRGNAGQANAKRVVKIVSEI